MKRLMQVAHKVNQHLQRERPLLLRQRVIAKLSFKIQNAVRHTIPPRRLRITLWQRTIPHPVILRFTLRNIDIVPRARLGMVLPVVVSPWRNLRHRIIAKQCLHLCLRLRRQVVLSDQRCKAVSFAAPRPRLSGRATRNCHNRCCSKPTNRKTTNKTTEGNWGLILHIRQS